MSQIPIKGVIFDLGDVLFKWSRSTKTALTAETMKMILSSPPWFEYECGRISRSVCYDQVAELFHVDVTQVAEAFSQARASLQPDPAVVSFLRNLKQRSPIKIYAMSNVSKEDFSALSEKMDPCLFERVFTSGAQGMRKPDPRFYQLVLNEIKLPSDQVIFVDDNFENVAAANRMGIRGFIYDDSTLTILHDILFGPVARGYQYLYQSDRCFDSITDTGVAVGDNFAKLLILEATKDLELSGVKMGCKKTWNFFSGEATLVPGGYFPDDLDTTALALSIMPPEQPEIITEVLDQMAKCVTSDGWFLTYFDRERPRTDAVVTANVLACFYRHDRGHEFSYMSKHIQDILLNRTYLMGTRYYPSPDCCLGFFERLLRFAKNDAYLRFTIGSLLKSRLEERVGKPGSALDLAMRITACDSMGIECSVDRLALIGLQCIDGSWEPGWMYRYGSTGVRIGNRSLTTALALNAITSLASIPQP